MARSHLRHNVFHLHHGASASEPFHGLANAVSEPLPDLVRRGSTPSSTCGANDNTGACQKPVQQSTFTVPIAVGIAVPIGIAMILLLVLHRRHVKKLRREDANDRHKSLDFGMYPSNAPRPGKKNKKPIQSNSALEKSLHRSHGMSMDLGTPYLLPPGLQSSHESLHSMSRTIHAVDDPYRPAITYFPGDASVRSMPTSKLGGDDSSSYTASSSRGCRQDGSTLNLISNAQRMSRSQPPTQRNSLVSMQPQSQSRIAAPIKSLARKDVSTIPPIELQANASSPPRDSYTAKDGADLRRSNNYLAGFIHSRDPSIDRTHDTPHQGERGLPSLPMDKQPAKYEDAPANAAVQEEVHRPPRNQSLSSSANQSINAGAIPESDHYQEYGNHGRDEDEYTYNLVPPSPNELNLPYPTELHGFSADYDNSTLGCTTSYAPDETEDHPYHSGLDAPDTVYDDRRISVLRPLPPDEPNDNPEQRANRIRSFYKEYFNESEPARTYAPAAETYYEDYGQEYLGDGTLFDPAAGQFVVAQAPYAQPITRRAMTPPPRAPPRFQGHGRHQQNNSNPGPMLPAARSRAASSASTSARFGPPSRGQPRRPLPPPAALRTLPTPHLLQEDAFALPIDFAPPSSYRDRQAGRPESPRMEMRPYSPSVYSHNPLASAFNELPAIPSPYQLRKSGAFTALDFAPPPRFKNSDTGSDAGSIRSGRSTGSTMSAAQMHSIRAGAYRVSRIPKEVVGTKDEIANSLKPQWNLNR